MNRDEDESLVRRHDELLHRPDAEPLSSWVTFFFLGLVVCATIYLFSNSGGFDPMVFNPAGSSLPAFEETTDPLLLGKRVFYQNCAICHQEDGQGLPRQFPPLAGSEWVLARDPHGDNHIVRIVLQGLEGPVTVRGQQFNNMMVPWGAILSDQKIAAVLTYVRSEWGNDAPPITPEFVAKIREETKGRTKWWTMKDLLAIPPEACPPPTPTPTPEPSASASPQK